MLPAKVVHHGAPRAALNRALPGAPLCWPQATRGCCSPPLLCWGASLLQDELRDAVLLVFANKQDLPNAMNAAEITDKLGLHSLRQRHWCVRLAVCSRHRQR